MTYLSSNWPVNQLPQGLRIRYEIEVQNDASKNVLLKIDCNGHQASLLTHLDPNLDDSMSSPICSTSDELEASFLIRKLLSDRRFIESERMHLENSFGSITAGNAIEALQRFVKTN